MKNRINGEHNTLLTEGSIPKGILSFAIPLFLGQLLQQLYNMVDAAVIGHFADNASFAAVSSTGTVVFLVVGFFNGISVGGSVVISRYFGAKDMEHTSRAIHNNFLLALIASALSTIIGLAVARPLLGWLAVPDEVMGHAMTYLTIYFGGITTVIMYNFCMAILRSLGDSIHPLYYLFCSSVLNIILDLLLVAAPFFRMGVAGAAIATVVSQGVSVVLCLIRMVRIKDETRLSLKKIRLYPQLMRQVLIQGLPSGIQNAVITLGNLVVQKNINSFGEYAMSGQGAYAKIEGLVFLPIMCMSMALPTFISQNLGAKEYERAKKGAVFGIVSGVVTAELIGVLIFLFVPYLLRIFIDTPEAIYYGTIHGRTVSLFFFLLAFSHCAAGVLRGCGRSIVPMFSMLAFWCGVRILYVTVALQFFPVFRTISMAYPITWSLSSILFFVFLLKSDWTHYYEKKLAADN